MLLVGSEVEGDFCFLIYSFLHFIIPQETYANGIIKTTSENIVLSILNSSHLEVGIRISCGAYTHTYTHVHTVPPVTSWIRVSGGGMEACTL